MHSRDGDGVAVWLGSGVSSGQPGSERDDESRLNPSGRHAGEQPTAAGAGHYSSCVALVSGDWLGAALQERWAT